MHKSMMYSLANLAKVLLIFSLFALAACKAQVDPGYSYLATSTAKFDQKTVKLELRTVAGEKTVIASSTGADKTTELHTISPAATEAGKYYKISDSEITGSDSEITLGSKDSETTPLPRFNITTTVNKFQVLCASDDPFHLPSEGQVWCVKKESEESTFVRGCLQADNTELTININEPGSDSLITCISPYPKNDDGDKLPKFGYFKFEYPKEKKQIDFVESLRWFRKFQWTCNASSEMELDLDLNPSVNNENHAKYCKCKKEDGSGYSRNYDLWVMARSLGKKHASDPAEKKMEEFKRICRNDLPIPKVEETRTEAESAAGAAGGGSVGTVSTGRLGDLVTFLKGKGKVEVSGDSIDCRKNLRSSVVISSKDITNLEDFITACLAYPKRGVEKIGISTNMTDAVCQPMGLESSSDAEQACICPDGNVNLRPSTKVKATNEGYGQYAIRCILGS